MNPPFRPPLPQQDNLIVAVSRGLAVLRTQRDECLDWLGADRDERGRIRVRVLGQPMSVDDEAVGLVFEDGTPVEMRWQVLVIHYLSAAVPVELTDQEIVFADIPDTRGYQDVYENRVIKRLCRTAGRTAEAFERAAQAIGGCRCPGEGDLAFRFDVLPRVSLRIVWFAGDEDFPPNAVFLFPSHVVHLLPAEDIVVLSELVVGRLARA